MEIHFYASAEAAQMHRETVERVSWVDGFVTENRNEIVFRREADGEEVSIPFAQFICVVPEKEARADEV